VAKEDDSKPEEKETPETEVDETEEDDSEEEESGDEKTKTDPELEKAIRARDRAKATSRKLQEQLDAQKKKDDKPDPVAQANRRLVTSSARAVLAAQGVTDKEDQKAVIAVLNLSDIEVDDEDGPDEDMIEERITDLRRIFGSKEKQSIRTPRSTKSKDQGGAGGQTDPDKARYARILGG
jgi:hypothetical protein